jgi:uncharacterized protein (TIGR02996 family)
MTEREALVAAIAANPDNDTPRLIFADWLQENGEDDRAEFIRLECQLNTLRLELDCTHPLPHGLDQLREESRNLFELRGDYWLESFYRALGADETPPRATRSRMWPARLWNRLSGEPRYTFHFLDSFAGGQAQVEVHGNGPVLGFGVVGGLVDSLQLRFDSRFPIHNIDAAFRLEPVHRLVIRMGPNRAQWAPIDKTCLRRVKHLHLHMPNARSRKCEAVFEGMTHTTNWEGLRELHVSSQHAPRLMVPSSYVEQLARSPLLDGVHDLWVCIDVSDLSRLTMSPHARNLRGLRMWWCYFPPEAGGLIASAVFRPNLETLDLSGNELGDEGLRQLVAGGRWPSLRSLNIGFNTISDVGVQHSLPLVPQLSHVGLSGGSITDAGALALADVLDANKLQSLWLSYNPISPATVERLRERFGKRFHFTTSEEDERRREDS